MLMEDSISNNIPVLVPTLSAKKIMVHEMYKLGQLGFAEPVTESYANKNLVITPTENDLCDRKFNWIYVDNQCRESDVYKALEIYSMIGIANGFITSYLMA